MSWILGSVDPLIVINLRAYKTAKTVGVFAESLSPG
jgi:hypothetical protein